MISSRGFQPFSDKMIAENFDKISKNGEKGTTEKGPAIQSGSLNLLLNEISDYESTTNTGSLQESSDMNSEISSSSLHQSSGLFYSEGSVSPVRNADDGGENLSLHFDANPVKRRVGRPPKITKFSPSYYEEFLQFCKRGDVANLQPYLKRSFDLDQFKQHTGVEPLEHALKHEQLEVFKILFHIYSTQESHLLKVANRLFGNEEYSGKEGFADVLKTAIDILQKYFDSNGLSRKNFPAILCLFNSRDRLFRYLRKNPLESKKQLEALIDVCCTFSSHDCLKLLLSLSEKISSERPDHDAVGSTASGDPRPGLTISIAAASSSDAGFGAENSDLSHEILGLQGRTSESSSIRSKRSYRALDENNEESPDELEPLKSMETEFRPEKRKRGRPPKNAAAQSASATRAHEASVNRSTYNSFFKYCRKGNLVKVSHLLDSIPDLNIKNSIGNTALYEACLTNNFSIALLLLSSGANPNIGCGDVGNIPLHVACMKGNDELVTLLLTFNSDKNYSNNNGLLPKDVAKNKKIVNILETYQPDAVEAPAESEPAPPKRRNEIDEKLFLLSFQDTALTYFLQRQTNRILRKLGGLRKTTYRALAFRNCTDEEVELLENCPEVKEIVAKLDRHAVGLIESGEFLTFFRNEYSHRLDTSALQIERVSLLSQPYLMPPKMARKFKPASQ